tara:strand:- start:1109 stop:1357 length:249 start_codon:yes stop_codon:yes gene_type:complete
MPTKEETVFLNEESLLAMTRDELMTYILSLQEIIRGVEEENFLLNFLIDEYENSQASLGKAMEEQLSDYIQEMIGNKTIGEA